MKFYLEDFQNFKNAYRYDEYDSWLDSLRNNGYPSSKVVSYHNDLYEMDDIEYTWFVLNWS